MKRRSRPKARKAMKETMYSVQRQPRYEVEMKPPIKGAIIGPVKTVMENKVMAISFVLLSNMSEKTAATTASGQAPKKPPKKRVMRMVWRFLAVAVAILKITIPNMPITRGSLRPFNSDRGAHSVGPVAKPRT